MLFLVWLALSFVVVGAINLYLRYFGLPRLTQGGGVKPVDNGFGSTFGVSGYGGGGLHTTGFGSTARVKIPTGETGLWINSLLAWIYMRCHRSPEYIESWLRALTLEAEKQSRNVQIKFESAHASAPEFANLSTESSTSDNIVIYSTMTLKDTTLQISTTNLTSMSSQPSQCDVHLVSVKGQVKMLATFINNELSLQMSFLFPPEIKLQIRPTRTSGSSIDSTSIDNIVRSAIANASTNVTWMSRSSNRMVLDNNYIEQTRVIGLQSSMNSPQQQMITAQRQTYETQMTPYQQSMTSSQQQPMMSSLQQQQQQQPQPMTQLQLQQQITSVQQQMSSLQHQSLTPLQQKQQMALLQQQLTTLQQQQQQQQMSSIPQLQMSSLQQQQQQITPNQQQMTFQQQQQYQSSRLGQDSMLQNTDQMYNNRLGGVNTQGFTATTATKVQRLTVKVIKANGLVDTDFGSCNAYCIVKIDQPAQSHSTNVIRNTVNPLWDDNFVFEINNNTRQIQFEVLDRDKSPENQLLGRALVMIDEIRRIPSSRQIIPLTARPHSRTSTSGSVTVEFIFMDAMDTSFNQTPSSLPLGQQHLGQSMGTDRSGQYFSDSPGQMSMNTSGFTGDYSSFSSSTSRTQSGQLSAHDLALSGNTSPQAMNRPQDSPMLIITRTDVHGDLQRSTPSPMSGMSQDTVSEGNRSRGKKESFATALKNRFSRTKKPSSRSQSADRAYSSSLREGSLLRPPGQDSMMSGQHQQQQQQLGSRTVDDKQVLAGTRIIRSNSFSSSLRRLFKKDKKDIGGASSTTNTLTRTGNSSSSNQLGVGLQANINISREGSVPLQQQQLDRQRQTTPVPGGSSATIGRDSKYSYSTSVPASRSVLTAQ